MLCRALVLCVCFAAHVAAQENVDGETQTNAQMNAQASDADDKRFTVPQKAFGMSNYRCGCAALRGAF